MTFAAMAYCELHKAVTSETAPSPDSLPLTKRVSPEVFDPERAGTKPAALARTAFNRIYMVGGVGAVLTILGSVLIAVPQTQETRDKISP